MQAARVATRHFYRNSTPLNEKFVHKLSKRTHVYDKRNYTIHEDILAIQTAKPWDHTMLRLTQRRSRRFSQYMVWLCTTYFFWNIFKWNIKRTRANTFEKWDYQAKYWRDGYWLREFPEGMVIKEYSNGHYSVEPGQSERPGYVSRFVRFAFRVGMD